eukprot:4941024-Pleurochrysis_carterae.AAC.2
MQLGVRVRGAARCACGRVRRRSLEGVGKTTITAGRRTCSTAAPCSSTLFQPPQAHAQACGAAAYIIVQNDNILPRAHVHACAVTCARKRHAFARHLRNQRAHHCGV